jgi:hypothetical protein
MGYIDRNPSPLSDFNDIHGLLRSLTADLQLFLLA